jgi:hypothetical protein
MNDYQILTASVTTDLAAKVKQAIAKGWEPLGGPFVEQHISGSTYHQAMVPAQSAKEKQEAKRYRALRDWSINTSWSFVISHINEDAGRVTHSTHRGNKGTPEGMDEELDDIISTMENP